MRVAMPASVVARFTGVRAPDSAAGPIAAAAGRRHWLLWTVAAVLVLNFLFYLLVVAARQRTITDLIAHYSTLRRSARSTSDRPPSAVETIKHTVGRFVERLPDIGAMAVQAGELEALLQQHRLNAGVLTFAPEKSEAPGLQRFVATVTASGPYASLRQFLAELQASPSLWCIEQLFMRDKSGTGEPVELQFTVATYVRSSMIPAGTGNSSSGGR